MESRVTEESALRATAPRAHPTPPNDPPLRRSLPVGRGALWFSFGLGLGMTLVGLLVLWPAGLQPAALAAVTDPLARVLLGIWPLLLAACAAGLLALGTAPGAPREIAAGARARILGTGETGVARIRRMRERSRDRRRRVYEVDLVARCSSGLALRSRLAWTLDPVDANRLREGVVIPVRFDRADPARMVLDTRADSRDTACAIDADRAFTRRRRLLAAVGSVRRSSVAALVLGLSAGVLVGLLG